MTSTTKKKKWQNLMNIRFLDEVISLNFPFNRSNSGGGGKLSCLKLIFFL